MMLERTCSEMFLKEIMPKVIIPGLERIARFTRILKSKGILKEGAPPIEPKDGEA